MKSEKATHCLFVSDLHGRTDRYKKLFNCIKEEAPQIVFIGGDIFPSGLAVSAGINSQYPDFVNDFLVSEFTRLKDTLQNRYPRIFLILGNDDGRFEEKAIQKAAALGIWEYIHNRRLEHGAYQIFGYAFIPPSPLLLKDWERYDVSRYVDPGAVSPEEGKRSVPVTESAKKYRTIAEDLASLTGDRNLDNAVFLFHSPPYMTNLDRAALDGKTVDYAPLDPYVGSIAIKRFIEKQQPLLTLHGHVHESPRLTGSWRDQIGRTICLSAAHNGEELALIRFTLEDVQNAERQLI